MADKKKGGNVVELVWSIAEPLARSLSLELWDVRFLKEGATWYLRIIIDKEGGVGIDDCVALHEAIDAPLDELDPIEQAYNLQVSSAGIERELVRPAHFEKYIGAEIKIKLHKAIDNMKEMTGVLEAYKDGVITLARAGKDTFEIDIKELYWVRLDDFKNF